MCSTEGKSSYRFRQKVEWLNDDRIIIFGWTVPFIKNNENIGKSSNPSFNVLGVKACQWVIWTDELESSQLSNKLK